MSEIKISEMTEASQVTDNDYIPIIQNGVNKKVKAEKVGTGSKVLNANSQSTTDTYSANYVNNIFTNLTINDVQAGTAHESHSGGYYRIGNIVIVNVTVKGTTTGNQYILTGFPEPAQGVVACSCSTATNGTISYATISSIGSLEVNIANASNTYRIMSVYITNE